MFLKQARAELCGLQEELGEREKRGASKLESVHGGGRMTGKGVGERGGIDVQALGLLCQ